MSLVSGLSQNLNTTWNQLPGSVEDTSLQASALTEVTISGIQAPPIIKIESLAQIAHSQPARTMYFLDIDDTIFDSLYMLGSKAWRKYIAEATKHDIEHNWHDVLSLFLARDYPLKAVEECTEGFVQNMQTKEHSVFGLTARERKKWYDMPEDAIDLLTIEQLESVGVNFDASAL